jgi:RNA polymerase sigma factor (sigma-70 family)
VATLDAEELLCYRIPGSGQHVTIAVAERELQRRGISRRAPSVEAGGPLRPDTLGRQVDQQIRFCHAPDGATLAYATHGRGPPLVRAATWLTHLEYDWQSPVWRHWLEGLGQRHTVIRYDERGCGLSDREIGELSLDQSLGDLESVVDAASVERFTLLGVSGGGFASVAYAVRHPERVSQLVLYGASARGRRRRGDPDAVERGELVNQIIRLAWDDPTPLFRQVFTAMFLPDGTPQQLEWFDELQRASTSGEIAATLRRAREELDVTGMAEQVRVPTLVLHARHDQAVPFAEGRLLAALIPGARFVPLESRNHILLEHEPAWPLFIDELNDFLAAPEPERVAAEALTDLSAREREVLELVAAGLSNEEIAERLYLSVRTVERHLSNMYAKLRISGKAARAAAAARFSQLR